MESRVLIGDAGTREACGNEENDREGGSDG